MTSLITDIGIVLVAATALALIARMFRQPTIIGYILAGIIIGPAGLALVKNDVTIEFLSELGVIFLLFIVGLELNINRIRAVGKKALLAGLGQIGLTFLGGFALSQALGFNATTSIYMALILTLSSTIIVVKLYSDKKELSTLHGRIALGILLLQDIVAIIALTLLSRTGTAIAFNAGLLASIAAAGLVGFVLSTVLVKRVFNYLARWPEALFIGAIGWCFLFVMIARMLGASSAIGATIAGLTLSPLIINHEVSARVKPLRDFFATIFFVSIGMHVAFIANTAFLAPLILFTLFVMLAGPAVIILIMSASGFRSKPSFLTGIGLSQVSEFSVLIAALGFQNGILPQNIVSTTALIAVITFMTSTYLITYDDTIYTRFSKILHPLDKLNPRSINYKYGNHKNAQVILLGAHQMGMNILRTLRKLKRKVLVVDFDPEVIEKLGRRRIASLYGDIEDHDLYDEMPLSNAELIISTVPSVRQNLFLIKRVHRINKDIAIIVTAQEMEDAVRLYDAGAHYVILPEHISGQHISALLKKTSVKQIILERSKQTRKLKKA